MSFLKNLIRSIVSSEVKKEVQKKIGAEPWEQSPRDYAKPYSPSGPAARPASASPASGESWGAFMPDEPNQFNSGLTYTAYFRGIFAEAFPAYRLECDHQPKGRDASVFTLWNAGQKALVVEVMSDRSSSEWVRASCERSHVPYLRFYHDHQGWWNTKSYVIKRVSAALQR